MKKITSLVALLAFGVVLAFTNCRKPPPIDKGPCENVICDEGYVCVDGVCVLKQRRK